MNSRRNRIAHRMVNWILKRIATEEYRNRIGDAIKEGLSHRAGHKAYHEAKDKKRRQYHGSA